MVGISTFTHKNSVQASFELCCHVIDFHRLNVTGHEMVAALDITGERYGRLTAISRGEAAGRRTKWNFRCDCGAEVSRLLENVRTGETQSCGCLRKEITRERSMTHGHSIGRKMSRTLKSYQHAKSRCFNPGDEKYPIYGGRGITMCSAWAGDFSRFLLDMGECPPGRTLDRVDVNGHYEPRNCRWATARQQARTRTDNVIVDHNGQRMILKDFAALMKVGYKALHARVKYRGQTPHEAVEYLLSR